ncbi:MAG: hypothetical protein EHM48_00650 [Planctomycetaceae bacterium]|nr:MAG: hypothetical protein EHM48_00650 [Planctomycetaceae bacterium]
MISTIRSRLLAAARQIAANQNAEPSTPWVALRKIFIQERRDRSRPGSPVVGWKRGELAEVLLARTPAEQDEEWGDVAYYAAQTWGWLWWLYARITPSHIVMSAAVKFELRAEKGRRHGNFAG